MGAISRIISGGRPQITLTNIVTNGNFVDTTGWLAGESASTAANNTLTNTANGSYLAGTAKQTTGLASVLGQKLYLSAKARVTNAACTSLDLWGYGLGGTIVYAEKQIPPVQNTWYDLSGVVAVPADWPGQNVQVRISHNYVNAATANGKAMEVQEVLAINLTTLFGAGNEPTAAQVDRWVEIFAGGWFDTTKLIPKRIY